MAPPAPGLGQRDMTVVHNKQYSFLTLTQPDHVFFFVFFLLEKPFTWPKRERYTDEDAEALAASVADHPISPSMVFGELWKKRYRGTLISIEEGVLEHWYHGRIVLAGDAVHKVRSPPIYGKPQRKHSERDNDRIAPIDHAQHSPGRKFSHGVRRGAL